MQFYPFHRFPYVAILDPRTGENLRSWNTITDSVTFCDLVTEFLLDHPSPNGGGSSSAPPMVVIEGDDATNAQLPEPATGRTAKKIFEESEEEQLKAAIAASLREADKRPIAIDDDSDIEQLETFDSDDDIVPDVSPSESKPTSKSEVAKKQPEATEAPEIEPVEDWQAYLGQGPNFEIVFRFPEGQREPMSFPSDSKLKVSKAPVLIELTNLIPFAGYLPLLIVQRIQHESV